MIDGTVLVVEETNDLRRALCDALETGGHRVVEAVRRDDALDALGRHDVDLIILAAEAPLEDSWSVLSSVRADPRHADLPIVVVSPGNAVVALRAGANDHVSLPFHIEELRARVTAAMRVKLAQDELRARNLELSAEARTDQLTGLPNRRSLDEQLARVASGAARHGFDYTLAILDIDHFKRVNDTLGHEAGDEVLRAVADVLRTSLRTEDVVGRWGGEEFVLVLPMTRLAEGLPVIERLRLLVTSMRITAGGTSIRVTMSAGCAAGNGPVSTMIRAADGALYQAKQAGRDRLVAAPSEQAATIGSVA